MLKLSTNDIKLQQKATVKQDAIKQIANDLTTKGFVNAGYVEGMLNREAQNSTFLGNGIAIPHGTTETRSLVQQTGVAVHHFPEGVDWGNGNIVYVAIGIAAKSDEHLGILKQITKVLSADGVEEKFKQATTTDEIMALLHGDVQFTADFNEALIQQHFPATDMIQMVAVASGLIKNTGAANSDFVAELISNAPTDLGHGLWLITGTSGVNRTAMAYVSAATSFDYHHQPVKAIIALSVCNASHAPLLQKLSECIFQQKQSSIIEVNTAELLRMFDIANYTEDSTSEQQLVATFKIKNAHGLHARPSAILVSEVKKFEATITVANLNGTGKFVNAKSLMKIIGLGVSHGHELQFKADGADAQAALDAIEKLIGAGLGEG